MMKCFNNIFFRQIIISCRRWCDDQPPAAVHGRGREGEGGKADLEKEGFPRNVYLFLDLNIFNIICSVCELCSCFKSSIELVSIRWPPSIVRVLLDYYGPCANIREYLYYL